MTDIEKTGSYKGYRYIIFLNDDLGYRSAYVEIPEGHKWYEKPHQYLNIELNNVIVDYSGFNIKGLSNSYCIGWHHNHSWDNVDELAIERAHPDKANELINAARSYHSGYGYYTSCDKIESECQQIIDIIDRNK